MFKWQFLVQTACGSLTAATRSCSVIMVQWSVHLFVQRCYAARMPRATGLHKYASGGGEGEVSRGFTGLVV